jgi:hypothetical protein
MISLVIMPMLLYSKSLFKFHANYQLKLQEMFNLSKAMPQASLLWNIGITINEVITKQKCNWQTGGGGGFATNGLLIISHISSNRHDEAFNSS